MPAKITIGDRIAYTRVWLKSVQANHDLAKRRGIVTGYPMPGFASVAWEDDNPMHAIVNLANVCRIRSVAFVE